jgi:hypothetical protein
MDDVAFSSLRELALPSLNPIPLSELERSDPSLLEAKRNRSRIEYYFTCTPVLPLYVMNQRNDADLITYVDADLFFFADPQPLFDELGDGSVAIVPHRFPPTLRDREQYGIYNVGWLTFRRDQAGLECLTWWRDRCLEWCYDRVEENRFADQKYLDDWPMRFPNVVVLQNPGANLAPWNISKHSIDSTGRRITVDSRPLIFFHFHGLKQIGKWLYDPGWKEYGVKPSKFLRAFIYLPYIRALRQMTRVIASRLEDSLPSGIRLSTETDRPNGGLRRLRSRVRDARNKTREIARGELILCFVANEPAVIADQS